MGAAAEFSPDFRNSAEGPAVVRIGSIGYSGQPELTGAFCKESAGTDRRATDRAEPISSTASAVGHQFRMQPTEHLGDVTVPADGLARAKRFRQFFGRNTRPFGRHTIRRE
jgi:hypothetical protein